MKPESEKLLERKLSRGLKRQGGWALKMLSAHVTGLPDRLCLLPGGRIFFAEVKTTGEKPRKIQRVMHRRLRKLGFRVEIIDRSSQIEQLLEEYAN